MHRLKPIAFALLIALLVSPALGAQDQTFAFRFGPSLLEPTGDSSSGSSTKFDHRGGFAIAFEWLFHPHLGLEVSHDITFDVDVVEDEDFVAASTFSTMVVGLNVHPVRTERIDWALGAFMGTAFFTDWHERNDRERYESKSDFTWGAQTFVDITANRTWAVNLGAKYYDTGIELDRLGTIDYDPLIFSVKAVVRW